MERFRRVVVNEEIWVCFLKKFKKQLKNKKERNL